MSATIADISLRDTRHSRISVGVKFCPLVCWVSMLVKEATSSFGRRFTAECIASIAWIGQYTCLDHLKAPALRISS